ncbi:uncharacterized protein LOC115231434 [Octopus sinensis]|uniref:Uncharacterized protein LOC115231434 n=1 Tax=Octopus sinensis TaxID=2607531 RepID=A0A6P7TXZ9_9MOLL|nr:uncharacterized protein LOC115231434 [Octopus sinensis]
MVVTSGKCLAYTFRVLSATILLVLSNASGNQAVSLLTYSLEVNNGMAITLCESNDATMVSMADDLHPNISEWFQKNRNNSVTTYWIAHSDCPNNGCAMMDNNHTMECVQCSDKRLVFCKKERPCQYVKNVTSAFRELIQEDNLNDCEHNCCTKTKCVGWSFTANGCYHYNSTLDTTTEGTIANTKQPLNSNNFLFNIITKKLTKTKHY